VILGVGVGVGVEGYFLLEAKGFKIWLICRIIGVCLFLWKKCTVKVLGREKNRQEKYIKSSLKLRI
jgi:hypothetical protein